MCPTATGLQFQILDSSLELSIIDSIPNNSISSHTKEQIGAILFSDKEEIQLQFKPVQVHYENANCEVFAVAFATAYTQEETLLS